MFRKIIQCHLQLDFFDANLGENIANLRFLKICFSKLISISRLDLDLSENNLGKNEENFKFIGEALSQ